MLDKIKEAGKYLGVAARLMVGLSSYEFYIQHMNTNHPHEKPMTYDEFFLNRQKARFGGEGNIKCC